MVCRLRLLVSFDAKGSVVDNVFFARRIMLGQHREGHVEFDGETRIRSDLLVGTYVEVYGFLNEQLQVVADKVKVVGDGGVDFSA